MSGSLIKLDQSELKYGCPSERIALSRDVNPKILEKDNPREGVEQLDISRTLDSAALAVTRGFTTGAHRGP